VQVPPHFFLHHLTTNTTDLPDVCGRTT
jgi:hypothetical protein